jgi:uncharacterized hydrophobic protein (TIGR00271 family)
MTHSAQLNSLHLTVYEVRRPLLEKQRRLAGAQRRRTNGLGAIMTYGWNSIPRLWTDILAGWAPLQEDKLPADDLLSTMSRSSIPSFSFFFMLGLATAIATFGLIANSAPAIIGAMIIAPLMSPILSLSYGLVVFDRRMTIWSILTVINGVILVIAIAFTTSMLFGLRITGSEILARTSPTLLDLGVALAAGGAAAFSQTHRSIANSIAGVAIAVALVPPLSVSGIGLAMGRAASTETGSSLAELGLFGGGTDIAAGAFVLFLTNLIGIIAVAMLVFIFQRYGQWKKALIALIVISTSSILLVPPLDQALHVLYVKNRVVRIYVETLVSHPEILSPKGKLLSVNAAYQNGLLHIYVDGLAVKDMIPNAQKRMDQIRKIISEDIGEPVVLVADLIPVETVQIKSAPTEMGR